MDNPENLPAKQNAYDAADDILAELARRKHQAALAESALKFSLDIQAAVHKLLAGMLFHQIAGDGIKFRTPQGRNAMVVLAIGDDAVGILSDKLYEMQNPVAESGPEKKGKDDDTRDADWWKHGGKPPV